MIARILPKLFIDQMQVSLDETDRQGADSPYIRILLQQQEYLEQSGWMVREHLVIGRGGSKLDLPGQVKIAKKTLPTF